MLATAIAVSSPVSGVAVVFVGCFFLCMAVRRHGCLCFPPFLCAKPVAGRHNVGRRPARMIVFLVVILYSW